MTTNFTIGVTVHIACSIEGCDNRIDKVQMVWARNEFAYPEIPYGWTAIGDRIVCDRHEILIDGAKLT